MTMGFEDDGDPPMGQTDRAVDHVDVEMDIEETTVAVVGKSMEKSGRSSLQNEAAKTAGTTTTGMQKIVEGNEEEEEAEEEILGMKTRNWRKINIAFEIKLDGDEISNPHVQSEHEPMKGSNKPMNHHPIMSKIANFVAATEKKCKTVRVMSSKNKLVLDTKVCMDSWSINKFKSFFAYSIVKNRQRNVQVTLHIDYGMTQNLWKLKHKLLDTLKSEGLWIINHNGPIDVVETTQIGFVAKFHPDLHRSGFQEKINDRIDEFVVKRRSELLLRAEAIPSLRDWTGTPLPEIQIIPLTIPGSKISTGRSAKVQAVGFSVQSKYRSLFRYILSSVCYEMGYDYVDFSMKHDTQLKVTYNKLIRTHQEFMFNHKTINIHQLERKEMNTCMKDLQAIPTVISIDETVITERNGTWVLIMKLPLVHKDLEKIDSIIANNPVMENRSLHHLPFRKRQPIECMNLDAVSSQENRFKNFTATPFGPNDTWSNKLFPPRNITTQKGGRSTKTAISIDDDTVATLADTVATLQRKIQQITEEMKSTSTTITSIKDRVTIGESRGKKQATAIGLLENSQLLLTQTVTGQMKSINDKITASEIAREESEHRNNTAREEAKLEKLESDRMIQSMLQQLLNNNSNNNDSNNTITPQPVHTNITNNHTAQQVQIYGGGSSTQNTVTDTRKAAPLTNGTVKRNAKSMSTSPNEQDTPSPDRRKQRQNKPVPTEIDFEQYTANTDDTEMEIQNHFQEATQQELPSDNTDTEMDHDIQETNVSGVDNVGTGASFATRDSDETSTFIEEVLSVTDHNFNSTIDEMDYTNGFTDVRNGSPNRTTLRQRRNDRFTPNQYSVLESPIGEVINTNKNKDLNITNTSAKTDMNTNNE